MICTPSHTDAMLIPDKEIEEKFYSYAYAYGLSEINFFTKQVNDYPYIIYVSKIGRKYYYRTCNKDSVKKIRSSKLNEKVENFYQLSCKYKDKIDYLDNINIEYNSMHELEEIKTILLINGFMNAREIDNSIIFGNIKIVGNGNIIENKQEKEYNSLSFQEFKDCIN